MDDLSIKVLDNFRGQVVRKDLTNLMKRGANVPGYVLEYLLGLYCATDDEEVISQGIKKISKILATNFVRPEEVERLKSVVREEGQYTIIDKIVAKLDPMYDKYIAHFANFDVDEFALPDEYAVKYPKIFMGGIWCMAKISYSRLPQGQVVNENTDEKELKKVKQKYKIRKDPLANPFSIVSLKPIEVATLDVDELIENRSKFTTDEWISFILRSTGIEPESLNQKEKLHLIERLVPLFERNYNLTELGPRGTGKSYVYKEISPYSILISGGRSTVSNLFYSLRQREVGLVGHWDCVAFDEVAGLGFNGDLNGIQLMKDYMASGSFVRGTELINADASMVFIGNINDSVQNLMKVSHLFSPFNKHFANDSAFFDRMHYYIPGWEIPKIKSSILAEEFGLISDCFAQFARKMRELDYSHELDQYFKLNGDYNIRDENAVRKTVSGLLKIIFPDKNYVEQDVEMVLAYAIEGRRRVKEQLRKIAGEEFSAVKLGYITKEGKEVIVDLPEKSDTTLIPSALMDPGHIFTIGRGNGEVTGVYKIETKKVPGNAKITVQGIRKNKIIQESIDAAGYYFLENARKFRKDISYNDYDYLSYIDDIQENGLTLEMSLAYFISMLSVALDRPVLESTAVVGTIKMSGTLTSIKNVEEYVRAAYNAGAKNILLPRELESDFDNIKDQVLKQISPLYYDDPIHAAELVLIEEDNKGGDIYE